MNILYKPRLMFVGCAGVGKSYLINALLGQDKTTESYATEETVKIVEYPSDKYILIDTPGVDGLTIAQTTERKTTLRKYINDCDPTVIIICYDTTRIRNNDQYMLISDILAINSGLIRNILVVFTKVNLAIQCYKLTNSNHFILSKIIELEEKFIVLKRQQITYSGAKHSDSTADEWFGKFNEAVTICVDKHVQLILSQNLSAKHKLTVCYC